MVKDLNEAVSIAAKAMQEYTNNSVSHEFMEHSSWLTQEDKFTYKFELMDETNAKAARLSKGQVGHTGWIKPPTHLLTIYIDKQTGETFIRRQVKQYPWEQAA